MSILSPTERAILTSPKRAALAYFDWLDDLDELLGAIIILWMIIFGFCVLIGLGCLLVQAMS